MKDTKDAAVAANKYNKVSFKEIADVSVVSA